MYYHLEQHIIPRRYLYMTDNEQLPSIPAWKGFLLFLFFFAAMVSFAMFILFAVPALQKKFLVTGSPVFIEYQADYGLFAITGFICFALLVLTVAAVFITPGFSKIKGSCIFISVLLVFWFAGIAEAICTYSYITKDGIVMRKLFPSGEKFFSWDDLKKIEISFYSTSSAKGGSTYRMMRWDIIPAEGYSMTIREYAHGKLLLTRTIYGKVNNRKIFTVAKDESAEWTEAVREYSRNVKYVTGD